MEHRGCSRLSRHRSGGPRLAEYSYGRAQHLDHAQRYPLLRCQSAHYSHGVANCRLIKSARSSTVTWASDPPNVNLRFLRAKRQSETLRLACIAHKSLEISERCRLWQQNSSATPENSAAFWRGDLKTVCFDSFILKRVLKQTRSVFLRAINYFESASIIK